MQFNQRPNYNRNNFNRNNFNRNNYGNQRPNFRNNYENQFRPKQDYERSKMRNIVNAVQSNNNYQRDRVNSESDVLCFNCNQYEHMSMICPYAKDVMKLDIR